jgi:hypothetical protein
LGLFGVVGENKEIRFLFVGYWVLLRLGISGIRFWGTLETCRTNLTRDRMCEFGRVMARGVRDCSGKPTGPPTRNDWRRNALRLYDNVCKEAERRPEDLERKARPVGARHKKANSHWPIATSHVNKWQKIFCKIWGRRFSAPTRILHDG